jgi:hypothetical protein
VFAERLAGLQAAGVTTVTAELLNPTHSDQLATIEGLADILP